MKKFGKFLLLAAFILSGAVSLFAAGTMGLVSQEAGSGVHELVLLHTNDHHGTVLPRSGVGGLAERAAFVRSVKEQHQNVLLLDAGDMNTGTALSNMFQAAPDLLAYNMMGYDAMTFGNHEYNEGLARMENQMALADFPMFSSNVRRPDGSYLGGQQYVVKEYDGFKVGIFAITTLRALVISNPDRSLTFINEIAAAQEAVNLLRYVEGVDVIIGLVHMGTTKESPEHITSQELAMAVNGIDIIVDGHSHTFMEVPLTVGNTFIVSAHERGGIVGQGTLRIYDGRLRNFYWAPVEIAGIAPDAQVNAMLSPFIELANISLTEVVGTAAETFRFGNRETRFQ